MRRRQVQHSIHGFESALLYYLLCRYLSYSSHSRDSEASHADIAKCNHYSGFLLWPPMGMISCQSLEHFQYFREDTGHVAFTVCNRLDHRHDLFERIHRVALTGLATRATWPMGDGVFRGLRLASMGRRLRSRLRLRWCARIGSVRECSASKINNPLQSQTLALVGPILR